MPMTTKDVKKGTEISASALSYRPEWSLGDFWGALDGAATIKPDDAPEVTWDISASRGRRYSWQDINLDDGLAESGNDLCFVVSKSSTRDHTNQLAKGLSSVLDSMTFNLSFQALRSFDISPGDWNADLSEYSVMQGVMWEDLVQPTSILIGFGPSLNVTFTDQSKDAFDKEFSQTKESHDTGLRILGFQVTGSKDVRTGEDKKSEGESHYDK